MRPVLLAALSCACAPLPEASWPDVVPGAPVAGAAESTLNLPVGTPLGGFSARAGYLGSQSRQDSRDSAYSVGFVESTGIHTRPGLKAVWIDNGDDDLVLIKADIIYSYDGLVTEITARLSEATGRDLRGRVTLSANHSHHSYGPFSDQVHFYLGGDRYNEEIFQRFAEQATAVALEAFDKREPAAIGTGWARDWDPNDAVYRDRRGENNDVHVWDDVPDGMGKDPYLNVIRVDSAASGDPLAILFTFGIHGIVLSEDNPLVSGDAPGALEWILQEEFDAPVVAIHLQGAGGDASPSGRDDAYARLETIGELAKGPILALWDQVPTSTDPISMETASRHIWEHREAIHITRDGTVDWRYAPYEPGRLADNEIWGPDGELLSPIDEFNVPYGAAFCGDEEAFLPGQNIGAFVPPYSSCIEVSTMMVLLKGIFRLEDADVALPLRETYKAGTTTSLLGPLPTLYADGRVEERPLYMGFFPAEPTAMYAEQFRRRAEAELGYEMALTVGYSQDHEGYFLIPEDWLAGGYEPNINVWGPLQGEHVMEQMLLYSDELLGDGIKQDADPLGLFAPTEYEVRPLPTITPDLTPDAGTWLTELPEYLWVPLGLTPELAPPAEVARVQGMVQVAWLGGDAMVDLPEVTLQRRVGESWEAVTSHSGRPVTDSTYDILTGHTPDPLGPVDVDQVHYWWAGWQAVAHDHDRAGLPLGTYRLHVAGRRWLGGDTTWPWTTEAYQLDSASFEVLPAAVSVVEVEGGLRAWLQGPPRGYRMIDLDGRSTGDNPLHGPVTVAWGNGGGELGSTVVDDPARDGARSSVELALPPAASWVRVTDRYGNEGTLER